jgi:hypothetical protein
LLLRYWVEARSNKKEGTRKKEERFSYLGEKARLYLDVFFYFSVLVNVSTFPERKKTEGSRQKFTCFLFLCWVSARF